MRRVLITGVTGYIGSHLARALLSDHEVYGLVRLPLHTEYISAIQDRICLLPYDGTCAGMAAAVREAAPDLVCHLAACYTGAHGIRETPALAEANITLGLYLLEAMAAQGVPALVYASTVMAHYTGAEYRPLNLYAATKRAFSDLAAYYADAGLIRTAELVLSDTYGPGDRRPKVLNLIKNAVRDGRPLALSDGGQDYDVVYIDDVVRAFQMAGDDLLKGGRGGIFQVVPEHPLTLRETAERMLSANGLTAALQWGARPSPEREIRRAVRLYPPVPGWKPEVSLEEGLKRILE